MSMRNEVTQESIISNIRSQKYLKVSCFGIVISARCDIAQNKVDCVHVVSAVPLSIWLKTVVFQKALSVSIKKQLKIISKWAEAEQQDIEVLTDLGPEKAMENIQASVDSDLKEKAEAACSLWKKYQQYKAGEATLQETANFLNQEGKEVRTSMLSELLTGKLNNFCFVPESAYLSNENVYNGLVADFKDIIAFSAKQIKDIQRGDYDYLRILATPQLDKLNQQFYLEDREDVVQIKYEIQSPWIERFMQNFAFSFIRVGVDTISQTDGKTLSKKLVKCDGESLVLEMEGLV